MYNYTVDYSTATATGRETRRFCNEYPIPMDRVEEELNTIYYEVDEMFDGRIEKITVRRA